MKDVDKFVNYLKVEKNYSDYTIINYKKDVMSFISYCNDNNLNYKNITYLDIKPFLVSLYDNKYKPSTISRLISSNRTFYKYLYDNNIVSNNIFSYVSLPKKEKKLPKYLTEIEIEDILNMPNINTPLGIRNRLIIELLYSSGIRVSELCNIKIKDIDFGNRTIKILGKGKKYRIVCFGSYCYDIMNNYINNYRGLITDSNNPYLIVTHNKDKKISERSIELIINEIINSTALNKNISPHTLRHTFATHLLNNGCDIMIVKELLGHSSLDTTGIYTHVSNEKLRSVYLKCHPRVKK